MILKKPYKFLIKHFRMIHLILAIMSGYLLAKTNNILGFFNEYLNNNETLIGTGTVSEYFNNTMILFILISLIGMILIAIIMKMKDKPIIFYVITLIAYILTGIIYSYDSSLLKTLELQIIDIRTIKLASDLTLICLLIQTLSAIVLSVRAVGFNIKKFNFDRDIELEINEKDNEEFEFDVNIDKNKIRRNTKKNIRNLKYAYHENIFVINILICSILFIVFALIYLNINYFNKIYNKNSIINTVEYNYNVIDSYVINKDYRGNVITDNYIVAVKLNINNKLEDKIKIEPSRYQLKIGNIFYNSVNDKNYKINDIGKIYNGHEIIKEEKIVIIFEIPKKYKNKKMILKYLDINDKIYKIKLDNINFDKEIVKNSKLNEELNIDNKLYKNVKFKIDSFEINDEFKNEYTFCETKTKCSLSTEYVVPTLSDNYTKTILKIKSDYNVSELINMFGKIEYIVNGETKYMNTPINVVNAKYTMKNTYYFEVYEEIKNASSINLILEIRNNKYIYKLK